MNLEAREIAEREVKCFKNKTGFPLETILYYAGISQRTWREWAQRRGIETKHNNNIPKAYHLTPEEVKAIIAYCTGNPLKGYRYPQPRPKVPLLMQCWEMVDRNVAADFSPMCHAAASITS